MRLENGFKDNYICFSEMMVQKFTGFSRRKHFIGLVTFLMIYDSFIEISTIQTNHKRIKGSVFNANIYLENRYGFLSQRKDLENEFQLNYELFCETRHFTKDVMLSSYSLEDFLPEIGDQGDVGSCVGWATAYYGLTIVKRLELGKDYPAFSPLSVFNRFCYLKKLDPCNGGSYIDGCLSLLVTKGCPLVEEYDKPNCSVDANTKRYNDCLFSFERLQQNNVNQLKLSLANNCPVVIGLEVFQGGLGNTLNSKFLDSNGVAKMEIFRNSRYPVGGHALCIVGYDDKLGGGAFKIANSWGKNWGKSGFFWLRYQDIDMVRCAYSLMPNSLLINKETKFLFKTLALSITNETAKNHYVAVGYEVNQGIETKGWFLIEAGMSRVINIAPRKSNSVYYITMDENGTIQDGSDISLSLKMKSFDISTSEEANSEVSKHTFSLWIPSNKKQIQALKITGCSKVQLSEN